MKTWGRYLLHFSRRSRLAFRKALAIVKFLVSQRADTLGWILGEVLRRARLRQSRKYCTTVLLSYPRSGNHATRALIEAVTSRPTLGCEDSEKFLFPRHLVDRPIFLRAKSSYLPQSSEPAAVKRHQFRPEEGWDRLIVVLREPTDAIVSHVKDITDAEFERHVEGEVRKWLQPVFLWQSWDCNKRLLINYTDIVTKPSLVYTQVSDFFGLNETRHLEIEKIFDAGIESLIRPPSSHQGPPDFRHTSRVTRVIDCLTRVAPEFQWEKRGQWLKSL